MIMMAVFAMSLFLGITFLGTRLNLIPHEAESILLNFQDKSQMVDSFIIGFRCLLL